MSLRHLEAGKHDAADEVVEDSGTESPVVTDGHVEADPGDGEEGSVAVKAGASGIGHVGDETDRGERVKGGEEDVIPLPHLRDGLFRKRGQRCK